MAGAFLMIGLGIHGNSRFELVSKHERKAITSPYGSRNHARFQESSGVAIQQTFQIVLISTLVASIRT